MTTRTRWLGSLGGLLDPDQDGARIAALLAQVTRADLAKLEALIAAGQAEGIVPLVHRMLGGFRIFADVPAFAAIADVIDALQSSDVDEVMAQLPVHRMRLLDFVDTLEAAFLPPRDG